MKSLFTIPRTQIVLLLIAVVMLSSFLGANSAFASFLSFDQEQTVVVNGAMDRDYEGVVTAVDLDDKTFTVRRSNGSTRTFKVVNWTEYKGNDVKTLDKLQALLDFGFEVEVKVEEYYRDGGIYIAEEVEFEIDEDEENFYGVVVSVNMTNSTFILNGEVDDDDGTYTMALTSLATIDSDSDIKSLSELNIFTEAGIEVKVKNGKYLEGPGGLLFVTEVEFEVEEVGNWTVIDVVTGTNNNFTVTKDGKELKFRVKNSTDFVDGSDVQTLAELKVFLDYGIEVRADVEYEITINPNTNIVKFDAKKVEFKIDSRKLVADYPLDLNQDKGWEWSGFSPGTRSGRAILKSNTAISNNTNRYVRSAWVYLLPGEIEFTLKGYLTGNSNRQRREFEPTIKLIDVLGNEVSEDIGAYDDEDDNLNADFTITTRGYYRFELGQETPPSRYWDRDEWEWRNFNWNNYIWQIDEVELEGKNIVGDWVDRSYRTKSQKNIQMLSLSENSTTNGDTTFFVGDQVELIFSTVIDISTDNLEINEAKFDVTYPSKIKIDSIQLWLNDEKAAYSTNLVNWINTNSGCGCPQELVMNRAGEQVLKNTLTIKKAKHKDDIKVKVFGVADEVGQFNVSIQYMGGMGRDLSATVANAPNAIISNSSSIIGFSTQNDLILEGDDEPVTGSGTILPNSTQPVELIYFRAETEDSFPVLEWATALEINNDYFSLERSKNGKDFIEVGRIQGKGDYSGTSEYTFEDRTARTGTWYYRLVQHDFNGGSKTYDAIRAVVETVTKAKITVLKNPSTSNQIVFSMQGIDNPADYNVAVVDMNGRVVSTTSLRNYYLSDGVITVDGLNLSKGVYVLNVYNNSSRLVSKVLVD